MDEIIESVRVHGMDNVCITGGEPFCHEGMPELVSSLLEAGYNVDLETNGSFDVTGLIRACPGVLISMDVKTPSSGMDGSFNMCNIDQLRPTDQLKFIVSGERDLEFATSFITKNRPVCNIIITPTDNEGARDIVQSLKDRLFVACEEGDRERMALLSRTRVMLQMHKVIWGDIKGV
jgi:7-carboxy-7-deazaguanine synthase